MGPFSYGENLTGEMAAEWYDTKSGGGILGLPLWLLPGQLVHRHPVRSVYGCVPILTALVQQKIMAPFSLR